MPLQRLKLNQNYSLCSLEVSIYIELHSLLKHRLLSLRLFFLSVSSFSPSQDLMNVPRLCALV